MVTRVENARRLQRKLKRLPVTLQQPIKDSITLGALSVENTMKLSVRQPGRGELYTTRFFTIGSGPSRKVIPFGSRPPHRASAPKDPPASDTGRLLGSIQTQLFDQGFAAEVGTGISYARFLEFGTDRMAPRPFVRPAWQKNKRAVIRGIAAAVNKSLRRSGK